LDIVAIDIMWGTQQKAADRLHLPLLQTSKLKAHTTPRTDPTIIHGKLLKKDERISVKQVPKAQGQRRSWNRPHSPLGYGVSWDFISRIIQGKPKQ